MLKKTYINLKNLQRSYFNKKTSLNTLEKWTKTMNNQFTEKTMAKTM